METRGGEEEERRRKEAGRGRLAVTVCQGHARIWKHLRRGGLYPRVILSHVRLNFNHPLPPLSVPAILIVPADILSAFSSSFPLSFLSLPAREQNKHTHRNVYGQGLGSLCLLLMKFLLCLCTGDGRTDCISLGRLCSYLLEGEIQRRKRGPRIRGHKQRRE